jgi:hypothetical protein
MAAPCAAAAFTLRIDPDDDADDVLARVGAATDPWLPAGHAAAAAGGPPSSLSRPSSAAAIRPPRLSVESIESMVAAIDPSVAVTRPATAAGPKLPPQPASSRPASAAGPTAGGDPRVLPPPPSEMELMTVELLALAKELEPACVVCFHLRAVVWAFPFSPSFFSF